jgi:hypothetical protein
MEIKETIAVAIRKIGKKEFHINLIIEYIWNNIDSYKNMGIIDIKRQVEEFMRVDVKSKTSLYSRVLNDNGKPMRGIYCLSGIHKSQIIKRLEKLQQQLYDMQSETTELLRIIRTI